MLVGFAAASRHVLARQWQAPVVLCTGMLCTSPLLPSPLSSPPLSLRSARYSSSVQWRWLHGEQGIIDRHAVLQLRKKGGGSGGKRDRDEESKGPAVNESQLEELINECRDGMKKTVAHLESGLSGLRTKASPALLDGVRVKTSAGLLPLSKVALVTQKDAGSIRVAVFEPDNVRLVEKAIIDTPDLGLTPIVEGGQVHVPVPKPTADLRQALTRKAGEKAEQARTSLRNARTKAMASLKKHSGAMAKDAVRLWENKIQAVIDEHNKQINTMLKAKEKELQQ